MQAELAILKKAVACGGTPAVTHNVPRLDVPKPKEYDGKRNAADFDDYLWNMERYFDSLGVEDELAKIKTATPYLTKVAALWWRRKHVKVEKGTSSISTWDEFKATLRKSFYPENVDLEARKKMKELRHRGSIRYYVEEFSNLMLQITDMSDRYLLFNFLDGLKPWAKMELQRRDVKDIATALTVAEALTEYSSKDRDDSSKKSKEGHGCKNWVNSTLCH